MTKRNGIFALLVFIALAFAGIDRAAVGAETASGPAGKIPRLDEWGFGISAPREAPGKVAAILPQCREAGINRLRIYIDWARCNPARAKFVPFPEFGNVAEAGGRAGLEITAVLSLNRPAWIPDFQGGAAYWYFDDFSDFAAWVVKQYGISIDDFEMGEDPLPAQDYLDVLRGGALAVRSNHPSAKVANGTFNWRHLYGQPEYYNMGGCALKGLVASGLYYFDHLNFQITDPDYPEVNARRAMGSLTGALDAAGQGSYAQEIRITLPPWQTDGAKPETFSEQAANIARAVISLHAAKPEDVRLVAYWPASIDDDASKGAGLWDSRLKPKAAVKAISTLMRTLSTSRYCGPIGAPEGAYAEVFLMDGEPVVAAWGRGSLRLEVTAQARRISMMGDESALAADNGFASVSLSNEPLYVTGLSWGALRNVLSARGAALVQAEKGCFSRLSLNAQRDAETISRHDALMGVVEDLSRQLAGEGSCEKMRLECRKAGEAVGDFAQRMLDEGRRWAISHKTSLVSLNVLRLGDFIELAGAACPNPPEVKAQDVEAVIAQAMEKLAPIQEKLTPVKRSPKLEDILRLDRQRIQAARYALALGRSSAAVGLAQQVKAGIPAVEKLLTVDKPTEIRVWVAFDPYRVVVNSDDIEVSKARFRNAGVEKLHAFMTLQGAAGWQFDPVSMDFDEKPGVRYSAQLLQLFAEKMRPALYEISMVGRIETDEMPPNSMGALVVDTISASLERVPDPLGPDTAITVKLINRRSAPLGPVTVSAGVPGADWQFSPAYYRVDSMGPKEERSLSFKLASAPVAIPDKFKLAGFVRDLNGQTLVCARSVYLKKEVKESLSGKKFAAGASDVVPTGPWKVAGPVDSPPSADPSVLSPMFDEEKLAALSSSLKPAEVPSADHLDFERLFGSANHRIALAETSIDLPEGGLIVMEAGSADGCRLKVNGKTVLERRTCRTASNAQDIVVLQLPKGKSRIEAAVFSVVGPWELYLRFVKPVAAK